MLQFLALALRVLAAGGRQHVNARAIKQFFLETELALSLGKLFVDYFPVEGHDVRRELLQLLGKHDPALGEIPPRQLFDALRGPLDEVGKADAEFDHALVIVIVEGLRHDATLVQDGPELIGAPGVVVADTHRRFAWIAADDDQLHTFSQMVGECSHVPSVAYFLFRAPRIRPERSQWSRSLGENRSKFLEGGNNALLRKPRFVGNAMKQEKTGDFVVAEELCVGKKKRGLGSPSCVWRMLNQNSRQARSGCQAPRLGDNWPPITKLCRILNLGHILPHPNRGEAGAI
jgi:hypothetical protein